MRIRSANHHLSEVKVDEVLGLVRHVRAKVAPDDAVPRGVVLLVKLLQCQKKTKITQLGAEGEHCVRGVCVRACVCVCVCVRVRVCVCAHGQKSLTPAGAAPSLWSPLIEL